MAADTMWIKTHEALNGFEKILTCKKCHQRLVNPRQFLNCGHFACAKCIGRKTDCVECKMPSDVTDIHPDTAINDLLFHLNIVSEVVGLAVKESKSNVKDVEEDLENISSASIMQKPTKRAKRSYNRKSNTKKVDETLNSSYCESVMSRSTYRGKANETIPKNINKKNKKGETALHIACTQNNVDRVKLLLSANADLNTKDNANWTPLQEAANLNYYEICELLLNNGALPNMYGCDSKTALHEAVNNNNIELVKLLLKHKANVNMFDNIGKQPKDYCTSKEMAELFETQRETQMTKNKAGTSHESNKTADFEKSINQSCSGSGSKVVLYGSNLSMKDKKLLAKMGVEKKIKVVNNFGPSVTHVVVEADSSNNIALSYDILLTIMHGKQLINSNCLVILMDNANITPDDLNLFELNPPQLDDGLIHARETFEKLNPKLFENCNFYFAIRSFETIKYDNMTITKENLIKLVAAGDGVLLTREPRPDDIQGSLSPFHVADDPNHTLHKCTHYTIYDPENVSSNRIIYNMPKLKTLPLIWFIESILRYKLIDPIDLGLCLED